MSNSIGSTKGSLVAPRKHVHKKQHGPYNKTRGIMTISALTVSVIRNLGLW